MTLTSNFRFVILSTIILFGIADAYALPLFGVDDVPEPSRKEGIVLIGIDSGDTDSHLVIVQLNSKGRGAKRTRTKSAKGRGSYRISLAGRQSGHFVTVLPKGLYQVTEVSYPYFDLPFLLDTDGKRAWQFAVENGKTSYIGQLVLDEERSKDSVDVILLNRLATAYDQINNEFAPLLSRYPLVSGIGVRDDFLEFIESPQ